jgi:Fe-Mn family superoxide dismutase
MDAPFNSGRSESGFIPMDRRAALASLGVLGAAGVALAGSPLAGLDGAEPLTPEQLGWDPNKGEYVLPDLPYPYESLEPHIDAETMRIHHDKHHAGYVAGLNKALKELGRIRDGQLDPSFVKFYSRELAFHGSGHVNHTLFWNIMAPPGKGGGGSPTGSIGAAIEKDFGSYEKFVAHFKEAAKQVEGSGWGWLVYHKVADKLLVMQGEKQQDMTIWGVKPLMGVDVWEHAYYLKYKNMRADYVNAFMNVISWSRVNDFFERAKGA